jgi:hypothetical protein
LFVAAVGTCSEADLFLRYLKDNSFPPTKKDIPLFMAEFYEFRDKVSAKLTPEGKEDISACTFIIVMNGNAYQVADLFVAKIVDIYAMGSGEGYAMGALDMGATVEEAVMTTCKYNSDCGLPLQYMEIERRKNGKRKKG